MQIHRQRRAIIIAAGVGIISTFLPWFHVWNIGTYTGNDHDNWRSLILFAVPVLLSVINDRSARLTGIPLYIAIFAPLWVAVAVSMKIIDFRSMSSHIPGVDSSLLEAAARVITVKPGMYLAVLAGIAVPVIAVIIKDRVRPQSDTEQMLDDGGGTEMHP